MPSIKSNIPATAAAAPPAAASVLPVPSCEPTDSMGLSCETSASLSQADIDALDLETELAAVDPVTMLTRIDADGALVVTTGATALSPLPAFQIGASPTSSANMAAVTEFDTTMSPLPAVHLGLPSPKDETFVVVTAAPPAAAITRTPKKSSASPVTSEVRAFTAARLSANVLFCCVCVCVCVCECKLICIYVCMYVRP